MSGATTVDTARLPTMLTQLRLPTVGRLWQPLTETADRESWPAARTLAALLEHEIAERAQRRTARHLLEARLPAGKTIDRFDFTAVSSISKARITALAEGDGWLAQGTNILLFGPLLPSAMMFSRRTMNSQRPRSSTSILLRLGMAVKSKVSKLASGSPRIADCTSSSKASNSPGSVSIFGLPPPPGRRMRRVGSRFSLRNSARPRPIVLRATPVASDTAVMPPHPASSASFAANSRRARSSREGASLSNRALIASNRSSDLPEIIGRPNQTIPSASRAFPAHRLRQATRQRRRTARR